MDVTIVKSPIGLWFPILMYWYFSHRHLGLSEREVIIFGQEAGAYFDMNC